jgi:FtsP/CotA-like multicopper oxidase with cupredoxin domain
MKFEKVSGHKVDFNRWTINGKSFPDIEKLRLEKGKATNSPSTTTAAIFIRCICTGTPLKAQRSAASPMAGLMKDVISVPSRGRAAVKFVADNPCLTLVHCDMQLHMDFGFMQLLEYSS